MYVDSSKMDLIFFFEKHKKFSLLSVNCKQKKIKFFRHLISEFDQLFYFFLVCGINWAVEAVTRINIQGDWNICETIVIWCVNIDLIGI